MQIVGEAEVVRLAEPTIRDEPVACPMYLLELEVGSVSWTHHPLCAAEHVAAQLVHTRYQEYSGRLRAGLGRRVAHKLQALRVARDTARRNRDLHNYQRLGTVHGENGSGEWDIMGNFFNFWLSLKCIYCF